MCSVKSNILSCDEDGEDLWSSLFLLTYKKKINLKLITSPILKSTLLGQKYWFLKSRFHWLLAPLQYFATHPVFRFWKIIREAANTQKNWSKDKGSQNISMTQRLHNMMDHYENKYNTNYLEFCEIWNYCFFYTMQEELQKDHTSSNSKLWTSYILFLLLLLS
jgi:hypothetical protein